VTMLPREEAAETFVRALYDDLAGPLFGFALRLTGDRVRAEEVVQEAFVRAWRRAGHLDLGSGALRGWLFTVARNVITDLWRADALRPVIRRTHLRAASVADDVEQAVQRWVLADALRQLKREHGDVLIAIYYEGRTIADAAQRLGVPAGTVKSRTRHAPRATRHAPRATRCGRCGSCWKRLRRPDGSWALVGDLHSGLPSEPCIPARRPRNAPQPSLGAAVMTFGAAQVHRVVGRGVVGHDVLLSWSRVALVLARFGGKPQQQSVRHVRSQIDVGRGQSRIGSGVDARGSCWPRRMAARCRRSRR
jgi:RNA polymerase sigma-70 factor (ECF subfamily)